MLTSRALALVFLTLSFSTSLTLAGPYKPYAPDLFERDQLVEETDQLQIRSSASIPSDSAKPYSPDLYFRRDLEDDNVEEELPTRSLKRRSPSVSFCKRDSECGGAHYCSNGDCLMRLAKRSLCKRDSMCSSGFCGAQGSCLERRSVGSTCADSVNACEEGSFCSTVDQKCKERRGVEESCRFDEGCQEGLSCLNFRCQKDLQKRLLGSDPLSSLQNGFNDLTNNLDNDLNDFFHPHQPSPSGSPWDPVNLQWKRSVKRSN